MPRPIHFEIHVDDIERAKAFYEKSFGWQFNSWAGPEEYWLIKTGEDDEPGINGGMMKRQDPEGNVYNTIGVPDIDAYIKTVEENGGVVVVPKMTIPGVGYHAYCKDTEGNIFGIHQEDPKASN